MLIDDDLQVQARACDALLKLVRDDNNKQLTLHLDPVLQHVGIAIKKYGGENFSKLYQVITTLSEVTDHSICSIGFETILFPKLGEHWSSTDDKAGNLVFLFKVCHRLA